jgi:hypothetical protein
MLVLILLYGISRDRWGVIYSDEYKYKYKYKYQICNK